MLNYQVYWNSLIHLHLQDMFKRLVDAVPEVKFELYSFKSTIKCKEMLEQDCWFENKARKMKIKQDVGNTNT